MLSAYLYDIQDMYYSSPYTVYFIQPSIFVQSKCLLTMLSVKISILCHNKLVTILRSKVVSNLNQYVFNNIHTKILILYNIDLGRKIYCYWARFAA